MNIWTTLFGGGVSEVVKAVFKGLDDVTTSDEERKTLEILQERIRQKPIKLQTEVIRAQLAHKSLFVSGWIPFIGWICGIGLIYDQILGPIAASFFHVTLYPTDTLELLLALLGFGVYGSVKRRAFPDTGK
jgi:hypothetical protein